MADTYTTRNRIKKPESGAYSNAWAAEVNLRAHDLWDAAIDGIASYTITSSAKTLTSTNGAADEARMKVQHITGGSGGTVTIPAVEKTYFVINEASTSVYFSAGGDMAEVPAGSNLWVTCDGTDCYAQTPVTYTAAVAIVAAMFSTTSVTSNSIGTGAKTFTVESGKAFVAGQFLRIADSAAPGINYMMGTVTSYSGTSLVLDITETQGSGTKTAWSIYVTGKTGATGTIADVQDFTASGTWTKPSGAITRVLVECWGAGGGGGSGGKYTAGATGGGGGGGGYYYAKYFVPNDLSATETVTIGAAGTAGAAQSSTDTAGTAGGAGGNTSFGSHVIALGGSGGAAGVSGAGNVAGGAGAGIWASSSPTGFAGGAAGSSSAGGASGYGGGGGGAGGGSAYNGGGSVYGGGGGGGGRTIGASGGGGEGGSRTVATGGGGTGGTGGVPGLNNAGAGAAYQGGGGAASAGTDTTLSGYPGAAGGRAGGGGGGSSTQTGASSGAGGAGGAGFCRVTTW